MFSRICRAIEETKMTIGGWFFAFSCIVLIRTFLENFSAQRSGMLLTSDVHTIVHYGLFYLVTLLLLIAVVHIGTQKSLAMVAKIGLFGFLIVLTPPLTDLAVLGGAPMAYLSGTVKELLWNYVTVFSMSPSPGITLGIRLEIVAIAGFTFLYTRYAGMSRMRSMLTALVAYTSLFVCVSVPNLLPVSATWGWLLDAKSSLLGVGAFRSDVSFASVTRAYDMYFNVAMSHVWYLLAVLVVTFFSMRMWPEKLWAVVQNSRPERVLHYFSMLTIGMVLAPAATGSVFATVTLFDATTLVILYLSFYFAWMFAVATNDIVDRNADMLTNKNRPLITGALTESDMRTVAGIFLGAALLGGFLAGHAALMLVMLFVAIYSLYSLPPLHVKRFLGINAFCISLATLTAVSAGFFTVSAAPLEAFPHEWLALILVVFTLLANVKDLKDTEGDRRAGVYTIPVIFGDAHGRTIVWSLVSIALLLVPYILADARLLIPGILTAACAYPLIHRNPFREIYLFALYFSYLATLAIGMSL
jgi:4-hydroxybenzoate polyprenyltransferase